jgi:hypothetical protein
VFPSSVRIAVALVLFMLGTYFMSAGRVEGLAFILGALYWLFALLRFGPVKLAFTAYRNGRIEQARDHLTAVRWPRLLSARNRAYYHWMQGAIAMHDARWHRERDERAESDEAAERADRELATAFSGKLRRESERAFVAALRAELARDRGRLNDAREHIATARSLEHAAELDAELGALELSVSGLEERARPRNP